MDDPFANVGGSPLQQEPGDPFHRLTKVSAERRKSRAIRTGVIVAVVVVAGLFAWDSVTGMFRENEPNLPQLEAQAAREFAENVNSDSQGAEQVASPAPMTPAVDQEVGDSTTLAILSRLSSSEESVSRDDTPIGAFLAKNGSGPCSIRDIVLQQEATSGAAANCKVDAGTWVSLYDGLPTSDQGDLVLDLIVSKHQAWIAGAWAWDQATRDAYANDIDSPETLIAVTATSAMDKAGGGIVEWRPSDGSYDCEYAASWVRVKYRWDLSATTTEVAAVEQILAECPDRLGPSPLRASIVISEDKEDIAEDESAAAKVLDGAVPGLAIDIAGLDPRFRTCGDANAMGFGPYVAGANPEYDWYQDRDRDGRVCEM